MNKTQQRWKMVRETKQTEYWVSDQGMCRRVEKKTGEVHEDEGSYNKYIGYMQFAKTYVHRLVAEAFVPRPLGFCHVDHANNDRLDNRAQNLVWVSRKANNSKEHARKLKRLNHQATPHDGQIIKAEKDGEVKFFRNGREAARQLGCSHVLVYNCLNRKLSAKRARGWTLEWVELGNGKEG